MQVKLTPSVFYSIAKEVDDVGLRFRIMLMAKDLEESRKELYDIAICSKQEFMVEDAVRVAEEFAPSGDEQSITFLYRACVAGLYRPTNIDHTANWLAVTYHHSITQGQRVMDILWEMNSRDMDKALYIFISGVVTDNPSNMFRLGRAYREGRGVEYSFDSARAWFTSAAKCGNQKYARELAKMLLNSECINDVNEAISILNNLMLNGDMESACLLAKEYYYGEHVCKDKEKTIGLLELAHSKGYRKGTFQLIDVLSKQSSLSFKKALDIIREGGLSDEFKTRIVEWELEKHSDYVDAVVNTGNVMNIMMVSSNEYLKYSVVLMRSIIDNHPKQKVRFFIVNTERTKDNEDMVRDMSSSNVVIEMIDADTHLLDDLSFPEEDRWKKNVLFKIIPHMILPSDVDRVLIMGIDTVVNDDITSLYNIDLKENVVAVAPRMGHYADIVINTKPTGRLKINGDVMVMDLSKMRKEGICVKSYQQYATRAVTEEDLIPRLFEGRILLLDPFTYNYRRELHTIESQYCLLPDMKIIQYLGYKKPWHFYCESESTRIKYEEFIGVSKKVNDLFKKWWSYAKRCSNYDNLISDLRIIRSSIVNHCIDRSRLS